MLNKQISHYIFLLALIFLSGCASRKKIQYVPPVFESDANSENPPASIDLDTALAKMTKDMTFQEAAHAAAYYEAAGDRDMVIKCSERLLALGGDQEIMRTTNLKLIKTFLAEGKYEKAQKYATDYQSLYPGTPETKLACYLNIQAHYLSLLESDRDQTNTDKTIELAQNFVTKYKDDTEYLSQVNTVIDNCYEKLLDREIAVINSYINKYKYYENFSPFNAAQRRLAYIKTKLSPHIKQQQKVADVEIMLAQAAPKYTIKLQENTVQNTEPAKA